MLIIGHIVILLIVGIDGFRQTKHVTELEHLVGVKVPNKKIPISSWISDTEGLIVEALPNNEM
jgi:hypothetical protein